VTQIQKLIRDPYAIYARHVLGLRPLDPLMRLPDALLRGTVVHKALEDFVRETKEDSSLVSRDRFLGDIGSVVAENVPWAEARLLWQARLARMADRFVDGEVARRAVAEPVMLETKGMSTLADPEFTLTAEADRIDVDAQGHFHIYDYKTGTPPNETVQKHFDKQLLLEAAIAERNGFGDAPPSPVARAVFLGLSSGRSEVPAPLETETPDAVWGELQRLMKDYFSVDLGFTARRAPQSMRDAGDYDHLARFGEWDVSDDPDPERVG